MKNRRTLWLSMVLVALALGLGTLIPLNLLAPINFVPNPAPAVAPLLREWHGSSGSFIIGSNAQILLDPTYAQTLEDTAHIFQQDLSTELGKSLPITISNNPGSGNFFLTMSTQDSSIGTEGYLLDAEDSLTINARTTNGVFYATRTVLQMLRTTAVGGSIPKGYARDYPEYQERGFMLDVGRKFVPLSVLEDYVRLMSWYKLNDFQIHFNDNALNVGNSSDWQHQYAAFRLNSPVFPGLAAKDGSYSQQDIQELVEVARQHAVTITPELDTPAHALALTQYRPDLASPQYSKEFLNLDNQATYTFVNALWNTFLPWFTTSEVNMGMDEYDQRDATKFRQYINYYDQYLHQKGKTVRMWGSLSEMQSNVVVNNNITIEDWNNQWANPVDMSHQGFQIINANDNLLYIVPHANYYHDFLDTKLLYKSWEPYIFSLTNPSLNLKPNDPHLLGGMFAVWNDLLGSKVSTNDITVRITPVMPVLGDKMWSGSTPDTSYDQFESAVQHIGAAPK